MKSVITIPPKTRVQTPDMLFACVAGDVFCCDGGGALVGQVPEGGDFTPWIGFIGPNV